MDIKVLGIDLAKNIFQLHGTDVNGKVVLRKRLSREKLSEFVAQLPKCLIGMESCGSAHYWARRFEAFGHQVKLMAPQFVKPYVKSNKNDSRDAEAIAEAVTRPNMRFVPIKRIDQQEVQSIHRARSLRVTERVALSNQVRGLLSEYGIILAKGAKAFKERIPQILEDAENELTPRLRTMVHEQYEKFRALEKDVKKYDDMIGDIAREDERCQRLMEIEGVGPITATAVVSAVGNATAFKNGREMSAWLGLVPRQHSSGNTVILKGISKRGDCYIRTLLIHGGRSVVKRCESRDEMRYQMVKTQKQKTGFNKTSVAVANKNARIMWALLARNECYQKAVSL